MSNFQLPKTILLDDNGDPITGGKLYFYETGTSTPAAVYADQALNTPLSNPVVADGSGRFAPIFLNPEVTYKLTVTDASDVTIYTTDPVKAYDLATGADADRISLIAVTPLDFGAIGDGVNDEALQVQEAIDAATGTVSLAGKVFRCDSKINLRANIRITDGTLNFSQCASAACLEGLGSLGSSVDLTADFDAGTRTITCDDTTGLAHGDYIRVFDGQTYSLTYGISPGEIMRIESVDSGTQLTVDASATLNYLTASSAALQKISTFDGVVFEDVKIICGNSAVQDCIRLDYGLNATFSNVSVTDVTTTAFELNTCISSSLVSCHAVGKSSGSAGTAFSFGGGGLGNSATNCIAERYGTGGFAGGGSLGLNRATSFVNCTATGMSSAGFTLGIAAADCLASNCVVAGNNAGGNGFVVLGDRCSIVGCTGTTFRNAGITYTQARSLAVTTGAGADPSSRSLAPAFRASNNTLIGCGTNGIEITNATTLGFQSVNICGNQIGGCDGTGVQVALSSSSVNSGLSIGDNNIYDVADYGVDVQLTGSTLNRSTIRGNSCEGSTTVAYSVNGDGTADFADLQITGNSSSGETGTISVIGLNLSTTGRCIVSENICNASGTAITTTNVPLVTIAENIINESSVGVSLSNCGRSQLSGNKFYNVVTKGIDADICTDMVVSGNLLHGDSGAVGMELTSANGITVSANVFTGSWTSGLTMTKSLTECRWAITGNSFDGCTTAIDLDQPNTFTLTGNTIESPNVGILLSETTAAGVLANNLIRNVDDVGIHFDGNTVETLIQGNSIINCDSVGIFVELDVVDELDDVQFVGNNLFEMNTTAGNGAIYISGGATSDVIQCTFLSNVLEMTGGTPCLNIDVQGNVFGVMAANNRMVDGTYAISFNASATINSAVVMNNYFESQTNHAAPVQNLSGTNIYYAFEDITAAESNYNVKSS